ncbi:MAG: acyl-CoA thioesterase [Bacteroidota bacterium]
MFKTKLRINFFDADPAGIMFYGNIFRLAHTAFEEFIQEGRMERNYFVDRDFITPLLHSEADYKRPLLPVTHVDIHVKVTVLKESSFEITYEFYYGDELAAIVKNVHVCLNKSLWKKSPLPEELSAYLQKNAV